MKNAKLALTALGDPIRQEIVSLLSRGPASVSKISERFPISRPAISKHLKVLSNAGLVTFEGRGNQNLYRLKEEGIGHLREYLDTLWDVALKRYQLLAENTERRTP